MSISGRDGTGEPESDRRSLGLDRSACRVRRGADRAHRSGVGVFGVSAWPRGHRTQDPVPIRGLC